MKRSCLGLAALVLAGCASGGTVVSYTSYDHYGVSHFVYAAAERDLEVRVRGNPFASPPPTPLADTVVAAMQGANSGPRTHFVTAPTPATRDNFHVALVFNPSPATTADEACADRGTTLAASGEAIRLLAAFCNRGRPLSFLEARANATGPADPGFRALIRQSTSLLFPVSDPFINRGECQGQDC